MIKFLDTVLSRCYKTDRCKVIHISGMEFYFIKGEGLFQRPQKVELRPCALCEQNSENWPLISLCPSSNCDNSSQPGVSSQLSVTKDKPWSHWKEAIHHDITRYNYSLATQFSVWARPARKHSWPGFVFLALSCLCVLLFQSIHFFVHSRVWTGKL